MSARISFQIIASFSVVIMGYLLVKTMRFRKMLLKSGPGQDAALAHLTGNSLVLSRWKKCLCNTLSHSQRWKPIQQHGFTFKFFLFVFWFVWNEIYAYAFSLCFFFVVKCVDLVWCSMTKSRKNICIIDDRLGQDLSR